MKLKQCLQGLLVAGSLLILAACSTSRHGNAAGSGAGGAGEFNNGFGQENARASGIGETDQFAGGSMHHAASSLLKTKTYYFDFDKSMIRAEYRPAILANADWLVAHPNQKIILEGHTDPRGSREYNVALGERRAESVANLLKTRGVNPDQIRVVSYGQERLAVPGHTESDYQQDRRAVIVLVRH